MRRENIFRSALFILSDDGQTRENIVGKLVEISICQSVSELSVKEIQDLIKTNFDLDISQKQLFEGVKKRKERFIFNVENDDFSDLTSLSIKLKDDIRNKIITQVEENMTNVLKMFVKHISDFEEFDFEVDEEYISKLISKFTYYLFQTSQNEVMSFFKKPTIEEFKNGHSFTEKDRKVLELFLEWDDKDKDKLLRSVLLFSFEYCMIVTNTNENALKDIFTNTNFYLDSNILVRAIGVNGLDWAKESNKFLSELKKLNSNYYISSLTYDEIKSVLGFKIEELSIMTNNGKNVNQIQQLKSGLQKVDQRAFYFWEVFYKWSKKNSKSIEKFRRYLNKELDKKIKEHNINIIKVNYVKKDNVNVESLHEYKTEQRNKPQNINSVRKDISNLLYVQNERPKGNIIKSKIKHFFLTEDLMLYKWSRVNLIDVLPLVITSTSVSTFYNKYKSNYQTDDFTSYMNYIDYRHNDGEFLVDEETIKNIVKKINQISSNPKEVEELGKYVNDIFNDSIEQGITNIDLSELIEDKIENQYLRMKEKELHLKFDKFKDKFIEDTNSSKHKDIDIIVRNYKLREVYRFNVKRLVKKLFFWCSLFIMLIGLLVFSLVDMFNSNLLSVEKLIEMESLLVLLLDIAIKIIWTLTIALPFRKAKKYMQEYLSEKNKVNDLTAKIKILEVDNVKRD